MIAAPPALPRPPWHPVQDFPSAAELEALLDREDGFQIYKNAYDAHLAAIRAAEWNPQYWQDSDPFLNHFELPHWYDVRYAAGLIPRSPQTLDLLARHWLDTPYARHMLPELRAALTAPDRYRRLPGEFLVSLLVLLGGNRAAKSELCAFLTVQSACLFPQCNTFCGAETQASSRGTQQALVWKYLPLKFKMLNGKPDRRGVFKIKYSVAGGFTEEILVLPNGSKIQFRTWNQDESEIEGEFLGSKLPSTSRWNDLPVLKPIGFWGDENAPVGWIRTARRRCNYSGSLALWSFTPIDGITSAIKEMVGEAETLLELRAELLAEDRTHVPKCSKGHMPYLQRSPRPNTLVMYFFSQFNPFGTEREVVDADGRSRRVYETFYTGLKREIAGANSKVVMRLAYGFTEDVSGRAFRNFSSAHVRPVEELPERLAIYQFTDPHKTKPFASIWVGVTPGDTASRSYYTLRNFPDESRYGEWAIQTKQALLADDTGKARGADGDHGPAARPIGWGRGQYKRQWRALEKVTLPPALRALVDDMRKLGVWDAVQLEAEIAKVRLPWWRPIIRRAIDKHEDLDDLREDVIERYMDSRFCNAEEAGTEGMTCLRLKMEEDDGPGAPAMLISVACGKPLDVGLPLVTDLLDWNKDEEFVPHLNAPRLYVTSSNQPRLVNGEMCNPEDCTQVRWMAENYTTRGGEDGACKEWADLWRHLAHAEPCYVEPGLQKSYGQGSY